MALPGDEVVYLNKRLSINGQPVPTEALPILMPTPCATSASSRKPWARSRTAASSTPMPPAFVGRQPLCGRDQCSYSVEGVVCAPAGHYCDGRQPR